MVIAQKQQTLRENKVYDVKENISPGHLYKLLIHLQYNPFYFLKYQTEYESKSEDWREKGRQNY